MDYERQYPKLSLLQAFEAFASFCGKYTFGCRTKSLVQYYAQTGGGGGGRGFIRGGPRELSAPQKIIEFTQFTINAVKFETESI
jgi:hypothetical protein